MREAVSLAASFRRQQLPAGLMQRLDMMQHLALVAAAQANDRAPSRQPPPRGSRRGAHVVVLAWFSLGVIASGAMGAGAIIGLRTLLAGAPLVVGAPAVASWSHPQADWDIVQMVIDRSQRARAPLALQVMGTEAFDVVMSGLPAGVSPSRGAPIGEGTWVLKPTDLEGLYLRLDSAVPDTFDVKIAVATSPSVATAGSIVQVRIVEMAPATKTAVTVSPPAPPSPVAYAGMFEVPAADAARPAASTSRPVPSRTAAAQGGDKAGGQPAQKRTGAAVAGGGASAGQPAGTARTMPEGAYGLGATPREPDGRTSWWQLTPPTWSPFLVGQERP